MESFPISVEFSDQCRVFGVLFELCPGREPLRQFVLITESSSGSFVRIFLLNKSSAGLTPVVECGVLLYARKTVLNSFLQSRPSAGAILIAFKSVRFWRSTSPFACDHNGVVRMCWMLFAFMNNLNSSDTNWGPLSEVIVTSKPCVVNMSSSASTTRTVVVVLRIAISKYRL